MRNLIITCILALFALLPFQAKSSHVLGGDITWFCQGGSYVFELNFYRDCNGSDINTISETIRVWNHPSISNITVEFLSRTDISPPCTQAGGAGPYICGGGNQTGNGVGALEKITYRSNPIVLSGTPSAQPWVFTYDNFSRSGNITNLQDPGTTGTTIVAKMFANNQNGSCVDSSPRFLQEPYFVSCAGDPFVYNMNVIDPDLDSLHIFFSQPLNDLNTQNYNPPSTPGVIAFEPGFSVNSPTPNAGFDPGNIPAQVDPLSGEITFLSNTIGNYVVKITVRSFRNGELIAEIDREMLFIVQPCTGNNNAPVVNGPFGGLFETTVDAGDLVNFTIASSDVELLQDGSPQSNTLLATGMQFGTNHTSAVGCGNPPCATLDQTPAITGVQGVSADFSWQTACNHTENQYGDVQALVPYHFVFKISDDYCPIPKVSYATITINVRNPGLIQAPQINCIQSDASGAVTVNWTPVADPDGGFVEYRLYSEQAGLINTYPALGTSSATVPNPLAQQDYYLSVVSGCNGTTENFSDTISNIFLEMTNPLNGTAILDWNDPINPALATMGAQYSVMREYPAGVWTEIASLPYGTTYFIDTIDICQAFLNYQIILENTPCDFTSNIEGDNFEDMITPDQPILTSVSINPLTDGVEINWNENQQDDTYGYVIYFQNNAGIIVEIDTVWGIGNTGYIDFPDISTGPLTYSVAAFDSCFTDIVPATYQTSAKAELHSTAFVSATLDICSGNVNLSWTPYVGWGSSVSYEIFSSVNGGPLQSEGTTSNNYFTVSAQALQDYCFLIRASNTEGIFSYSNRACLRITAPTASSVNYLRTATVSENGILLKHLIQYSNGIKEIVFERKDKNGTFEEIGRVSATGNDAQLEDLEVDTQHTPYTYRALIIDSCGNSAGYSNEATTMVLTAYTDEVEMINYLQWTPYSGFDGSIIHYNIYRGIDGVYDPYPFASVPSSRLSYTDTVEEVFSEGLFCYYIQAIESYNQYGFSEFSNSNQDCIVIPPLIYIPNAFTPNGVNPIFIPVVSIHKLDFYRFTIFDRWGQVIFQSTDPTEGWDGTINGKDTKEGTYVYMLSVRAGDSEEVVKRGHVTLLRE